MSESDHLDENEQVILIFEDGNLEDAKLQDEIVAKFKSFKHKVHDLIHDHENEIFRLRKTLKKIDDKMYAVCEHEWERDPPMMYCLAEYTCKKCGLSK